MILKSGVDYSIEELANSILREGRRGVTALSEKKDYLTEEQLALRQSREIPNGNGFPEAYLVSGLYRRVYSPTFGNRPSKRRSIEE